MVGSHLSCALAAFAFDVCVIGCPLEFRAKRRTRSGLQAFCCRAIRVKASLKGASPGRAIWAGFSDAPALRALSKSQGRSRFFEHDLVGKPVPTFPDHAL